MLFENRQIFIRVEQGKIESDQWIEWSWGDFQQNSGNIKKIMLLNFWKKNGLICHAWRAVYCECQLCDLCPLLAYGFQSVYHCRASAPSSHFPVPVMPFHSGLHSTCEEHYPSCHKDDHPGRNIVSDTNIRTKSPRDLCILNLSISCGLEYKRSSLKLFYISSNTGNKTWLALWSCWVTISLPLLFLLPFLATTPAYPYIDPGLLNKTFRRI